MKEKIISINDIKPDKNQPRKTFNKDSINNMALTIKSQGIIAPIEIDENNIIITGERRWQAGKIAGLKTIPYIRKKGLTPTQRLERQLIENLHHEDVPKLELLPAIKNLLTQFNRLEDEGKLEKPLHQEKHAWQKYTAKRLGMSEQWLSQLLSFDRTATPEVKEAVKEKDISIKEGMKIAKTGDEETQKEKLDKIKRIKKLPEPLSKRKELTFFFDHEKDFERVETFFKQKINEPDTKKLLKMIDEQSIKDTKIPHSVTK